ncbi:MAG: TetR/AcrR family transcriptional regulator [Butyrivibrio sp.]|nr:TetR/AcrR family transcriptional regulator [Butyrivibrio sp.]
MGTDARVRYTKMIIRKSIIQMLEDKPFHKLSLTDVCKKAEINRTTFYKYYKDIYDWKEQLEQECLQRTTDILNRCNECNLVDLLTQQFQDMRENAELYMLISSPNFESRVLEISLSMTLDKADTETKKYLSLAKDTDYRRRWDCYYTIYGCLGVIECWLKDGMQEAPHDLAVYYACCIHTCLAGTQNRAGNPAR